MSTEESVSARLAEPGYRDETLSITRRTVARRLAESKQTVPHFYVKAQIETDALEAARRAANAQSGNARLSLNDLIVKAVAITMAETSGANVAFLGDALRRFDHVDVSVAVSTPRGLMTPIVREADRKNVYEISDEIKSLAGLAASGRLKPEEYNGGNVSVSNLGMFGVEEFSAIINPPQSCIFAIGSSAETPVARNGAVALASVMTIVASFDHRSVDGVIAALVLQSLKAALEAPARLFLRGEADKGAA